MEEAQRKRGETQQTKVRTWLTEVGPITGLEALRYFGAYRLSAIIHRLRNEGLNITTVPTTKGNSTFATYILNKKA